MLDPEIIDAPLPEGTLGLTDGRTIWLDNQLTEADRAVVLRHELKHVARGHGQHCLTVVEIGLDRELACELIHLDALGEAAAWSEHVVVIADELEVLPEILEHRLHALTPGERAVLDDRLTDAHWT